MYDLLPIFVTMLCLMHCIMTWGYSPIFVNAMCGNCSGCRTFSARFNLIFFGH